MWNFAKSAEAVLSQFILKRVCKFLLKRKLGQFILGDIDLDQLDVQIAAGTIQLADLALNVEFINQKLGQTSLLRVQEGSIRSLLVKMPWTGSGCEVELDEVEIVLSPCCSEKISRAGGNHNMSNDSPMDHALGKDEHFSIYTTSAASVNVHEGVKTVAKMVKWLLTSFHVRLKNVIVAFETGVEKDKDKGFHQTLVLRITDLECGTCISEDRNSSNTKAEDFLGISHVTNFLRFEGVSLELLQMNGDYKRSPVPAEVTASGSHLPSTSKLLLTGERGGFSGNLKLSIPWKNGSLDTRKVDAEINVALLSAKLQPSTVKWILDTWVMLEEQKNKIDCLYRTTADTMLIEEKLVQGKESSVDFSVPFTKANMDDVLLEESNLISDWVPSFVGEYNTEGIEVADLGASVDQFFECFDGMRSSQSVLGSSGVWGWTSSVFSAITAASNLASGSLNMSNEQQHVQTNLKINLAGVLMTFSFVDDDLWAHGPASKQFDTVATSHHLALRCEDIVISVQVYLQEWKLEALVKHIVLDNYLSQEVAAREFHSHEKGVSNLIPTIQDMQDKVQSALPSSSFFPGALNPDISDKSSTTETFSSLFNAEGDLSRNNIVKAIVFETYGATMFAVSSKSFNGHSAGQASFSLKLPPFIFWLNLDLVKAVLDFSRKLEKISGESCEGTSLSTKTVEAKHDSSAHCDVIQNQPHPVTSTPCKGSLHGSVYLPRARIILCFPSKSGGGIKSHTSCDQFVALDFSSPPNFEKLKGGRSTLLLEDGSLKKDYPSTSCSVHLSVITLEIYYITKAVDDDSGSYPKLSSQGFCGYKIMSLQNGSDYVRLISMLWHENAVTGAWIIESAKLLAKPDDPASKRSPTTGGYEFASVSTRKDMEDLSAQKQREMILSSKFCLRVCLPVTVVTLSRSQYLCLFHLLSEFIDVLYGAGSDTSCDNRGGAVNQTCLFLECRSMKIQIELGQGDCPTRSLQRELPGSWQKLRLEILKISLLSVSDIGAVSGASFRWISHSEGKLWGSISSLGDQDLLLMSCSNSSSGRGSGEGSNVLYCRPAGSDFVQMCDPRVMHNSMYIAVKCGTIIAPGGRLDWLDKLPSFFSLPSAEIGQGANCNSQKADPPRASFVLKFIDAALSYQPYSGNSQGLMSKSGCSASFHEDPCDPYVSCLLAVSVLTLSDTRIAESSDNEYGIQLQDVGLLLHAISKNAIFLVDHSVNHLHELGYVKVAGEALFDALLKIKCESDLSWELTCSESHIVLSTCHDTTFGLVRLASQIQQLFAPDIEESVVHLQNRWNSLKQALVKDDPKGDSDASSDSSLLTSHVQQPRPDSKGDSGLFNLMDEICEDAFKFGGKGLSSYDGSEVNIQVNENLHDEGPRPSSTISCPGNFLENYDVPNVQKAELIEGYCISDLRSLSELTMNSRVLEDVPKPKLVSTENGNFQIGSSGWYERASLRVVEDYVSRDVIHSSSMQLVDLHQNNEDCDDSKPYKGRLLLKNIGVKWQMYAGSDWHGLGTTGQHSGISGCISGRDRTVCLELALSNVNTQYDVLPDGGICVSKLCLSVQDFFLYDKSKFAPWKLVLGHYNSKERPRESSSKALKLNLEAVRPDSVTPLEEYRLRVAFLPILLHLHQSQLDFLIAFFGAKHSAGDQSQSSPQNTCSSDVISENNSSSKAVAVADEALLPFFQKFDIWPIVVRVDYRPSRVDLAALSGGKYVELINLVPWKGVELQLKHVQAAGVYGWSNVLETAFGEWLEDISQNQIHKLLQGLPPVRSFVAVSSGAAKLVSLPLKNYRKDHRVVKGLQRGTVAFLRSISIEALGLGVHLSAGAHEILFHAECILTRIQPSVTRPIRTKLKANLRTDRPEDAQRGLQQAYESLSDGLGKSASALIRSPLKTYQRGGGVGSALVTAVRGAPAAAIAPASAAAQALHYALVGVRNSLDPEHKEESKNKYSGPSHSSDQS